MTAIKDSCFASVHNNTRFVVDIVSMSEKGIALNSKSVKDFGTVQEYNPENRKKATQHFFEKISDVISF